MTATSGRKLQDLLKQPLPSLSWANKFGKVLQGIGGVKSMVISPEWDTEHPGYLWRLSTSEHRTGGRAYTGALWGTPTATDSRVRPHHARFATKPSNLAQQVFALGSDLKSSSARGTGQVALLNPEFPCWLMGFPDEWISCAPSATRSSLKSVTPRSLRYYKKSPSPE